MKISIRPAPHSKGCYGHGGACNLYMNHEERCAENCKRCCEMKHCWAIGEALEKELTQRGHTVYMADKKYRKRWPESKASQATKDAMALLNAHKPNLHIAIHTNANSDPTVRAIQVMYPPARYGNRTELSIEACRQIAAALKGIYDLPGRVVTREYSAYEINTCPGAGVYLELGYANTNREDAAFVHNNVLTIASALADGIDAYGRKIGLVEGDAQEASGVPDTTEPETDAVYEAYIKPSYIWQLSLWNDNRKTERICTIRHGETIFLLSSKPENGYYPAVYGEERGYVDARYVKIERILTPVSGTLRKKASYVWTLNLWASPKKAESLAKISGSDLMELLSEAEYNGYYRVRYLGVVGYVDKRYVERIV